MNPDSPKPKSELIWNLLTFLVIAAILIVASVTAVIFVNPASPINPFRPPELPAAAPSATIPSKIVDSSPGAGIILSAPTDTAAPKDMQGLVVISPTPQIPTAVPPTEPAPMPPDFDFVVLETPLALPASEYDSARGCEWMGVAGQVFDITGAPVRGLRVRVRATLEGNTIEVIGMSGTAGLYGPSGYEVKLADRPIASSGQATVELIDQAGLPLSEPFVFDTYDNCDENLILIDFQEIR